MRRHTHPGACSARSSSPQRHRYPEAPDRHRSNAGPGAERVQHRRQRGSFLGQVVFYGDGRGVVHMSFKQALRLQLAEALGQHGIAQAGYGAFDVGVAMPAAIACSTAPFQRRPISSTAWWNREQDQRFTPPL